MADLVPKHIMDKPQNYIYYVPEGPLRSAMLETHEGCRGCLCFKSQETHACDTIVEIIEEVRTARAYKDESEFTERVVLSPYSTPIREAIKALLPYKSESVKWNELSNMLAVINQIKKVRNKEIIQAMQDARKQQEEDRQSILEKGKF